MTDIDNSQFADSAGVPWEGRTFSENPFANDDGSADPDLISAIQNFRNGSGSLSQVLEAFAKSRLLIPLIANLTDSGVGEHGLVVDKSAELAIVNVATPDGQNALPVFSSVAAMSSWNLQARPVPNYGHMVALAAASEGSTRIVLDPGSETELAIRRPAIAALAQGIAWLAPETNPKVEKLVSDILSDIDYVDSFTLASGDQQSKLIGQELEISLFLESGLSQKQLQDLESQFFAGLSRNQEFVELVDSVAVRLLPSS